MDLNLEARLNEKEQNELKRRAYSAMEQLFLEGVSAGRELLREDLHYETEKYIADKILFLSNYFIQDKIWSDQPPANYREKKEVPAYDPDASDFEGRIEGVEQAKNVSVDKESSNYQDEEKPDWAKKEKPFK